MPFQHLLESRELPRVSSELQPGYMAEHFSGKPRALSRRVEAVGTADTATSSAETELPARTGLVCLATAWCCHGGGSRPDDTPRDSLYVGCLYLSP